MIADGVREIYVEQFKPRIKTQAKPQTTPTEVVEKPQDLPISTKAEPLRSPVPLPSMLPDDEDEMTKAKLLFALILNNKKSTPPIDEQIANPPRLDISFPPYKPFATYTLFAEDDLPHTPVKNVLHRLPHIHRQPITTTISTKNIHNDFHNNYMFEFPNDIHIDEHMEITNYNFPKRTTNNITEKNNKFYINKECITVPEGYYNRYTLQDQINKVLPNHITCVLDDDLYITFKSTDDSKFMLIEDSLLLFLGYKKQSYVNRTSYTAEREIGIGDNVFPITIKNVCEDKPMFIVNMDEDTVTKTKQNPLSMDVDYFEMKIHIENNLNNEFFFKQPHELTFVTY